MAYELSEQKKIGLGLIGFGSLFSFLAMILFFDRGLLALGNIFWLAGVTFLLGWRSSLQLFTNKTNYKGSVTLLLGIFLIFVRWPIIGILFELSGCILLFGGFWPSIKVFLCQIPVLGWLLQYPSLVSFIWTTETGQKTFPCGKGNDVLSEYMSNNNFLNFQKGEKCHNSLLPIWKRSCILC